MQILVIKLGAVGDVIRTTAILPGLKERYKDCKIDWLTKKESLEVLKNNNLINNIFLIEKIDDGTEKINDGRMNNPYDIVISLDDDYDACKLASEVSSKKIIGAYLDKGHGKKQIYTEGSSLWFDMGLISKLGKEKADELKAKNTKTYQQIMYEILGLDYKKQEPILILSENELSFGKNFATKHGIEENDLIIGVNTGAGGRWEDKKLSIVETAELIGKLNSEIKNAKILLLGGPEEAERNKKIISLLGKKSAKGRFFPSNFPNIIDTGCDNSLMEFASLISLCSVLVTSDSLALHIGTGLRKRIVCFFYPTSSHEIELYNRGIKITGKGKDYCSYKTKCDIPPKWDVDEIVKGVVKLLE